MARHQSGDAVRITTANRSTADDIAARQRRYLLAMGFRTVCFVAAIFVTLTWARVVLIAAALVLPYVAVVMANAGSSKSDGFALVNGPSGEKELPGGTGSGTDSGADHL
jgi:hypothetical protein